MTLDEMILQRHEEVDSLLSVNHCDVATIEQVKNLLNYAMKQAHSQGKVDYAHEDLPEILHNHHGPF